MTFAFFPEVAGSKFAELPVYERSEVIQGPLVTLRPLRQQQRHFVGVRHISPVDNADLVS
jgi:hypothetical protein